MKKILSLTLIMVLAMAGMASAAATIGGEFEVEYVIDTDERAAGKGQDSAALTLTVTAEDEGIWDLSVDLNITDGADEFTVGDWTFNLNDELFAVELWGGGVEKDEVATPLGFIGTGDPSTASDVARMRLTSDLVGLADLTLDYEPDALYLFASKALNDVTVGGAISKEDLNKDGMKAAGHVKYVFGPATLTGEVGIDTAYDEDNLFLGGKVDYKLTDKLTVSGKVTHEGEELDEYGKLVIEPSVTYTEDLFKVTGKYTRTADTADKAPGEATNKLTATVAYRSDDTVALADIEDDLYDVYDELTGYAAYAKAAYTTAKKDGADEEPLTELTLQGAGVAVPDLVWIYGEFNYAADKDLVNDGDFGWIDEEKNDAFLPKLKGYAESYMRLNAEATVKVTDKFSVVPSVAYATWKELEVKEVQDDNTETPRSSHESANELELGAAFTYALTDAAEVGLSYTNRTQKFEKADEELNDSFIKVYFSTSF